MADRATRYPAVALALSGASIALVGACLDWVRSGEAQRSSFATLRAARTLGVLHGAAERVAPLWYLVPLVVGLMWMAAGLRRWRVVGALAALVGAGAIVAGVAVLRSPLSAQVGVAVAVGGAAGAVVGGLAVLVRPPGGPSPRWVKADRRGTGGGRAP